MDRLSLYTIALYDSFYKKGNGYFVNEGCVGLVLMADDERVKPWMKKLTC